MKFRQIMGCRQMQKLVAEFRVHARAAEKKGGYDQAA